MYLKYEQASDKNIKLNKKETEGDEMIKGKVETERKRKTVRKRIAGKTCSDNAELSTLMIPE